MKETKLAVALRRSHEELFHLPVDQRLKTRDSLKKFSLEMRFQTW